MYVYRAKKLLSRYIFLRQKKNLLSNTKYFQLTQQHFEKHQFFF